MRMRLVAILRYLYTMGILFGLLSGIGSATLFALAFLLGDPAASPLCRAGLAIMEAMIPIVGGAVGSGLLVTYLDPKEGHSFSMGKK